MGKLRPREEKGFAPSEHRIRSQAGTRCWTSGSLSILFQYNTLLSHSPFSSCSKTVWLAKLHVNSKDKMRNKQTLLCEAFTVRITVLVPGVILAHVCAPAYYWQSTFPPASYFTLSRQLIGQYLNLSKEGRDAPELPKSWPRGQFRSIPSFLTEV